MWCLNCLCKMMFLFTLLFDLLSVTLRSRFINYGVYYVFFPYLFVLGPDTLPDTKIPCIQIQIKGCRLKIAYATPSVPDNFTRFDLFGLSPSTLTTTNNSNAKFITLIGMVGCMSQAFISSGYA